MGAVVFADRHVLDSINVRFCMKIVRLKFYIFLKKQFLSIFIQNGRIRVSPNGEKTISQSG